MINISFISLSNYLSLVNKHTINPLGIYAWQSDTKIVISSQNQNKENAWKFVEYVFTQQNGENYSMVNGYKPAIRNYKQMRVWNSFLDQETQPLFEDLADKMKQYKLTPLDIFSYQLYYFSFPK